MTPDRHVFTVGLYGKSETVFFAQLRDNRIDVFVDIRRRRGLRGSSYAFANSSALQSRLKAHDIAYLHELALAPSDELRTLQKQADKTSGVSKRMRQELSPEFVAGYLAQIESFDFRVFLESLGRRERLAFFCVESTPQACHRSLVAAEVHRRLGLQAVNL
jgi:uncharacterized protein (DUF488 family)